MTKISTNLAVTRSDDTRELIRDRALERGQKRSDDLEARVREVMRVIEREIDANDGIYPHNGGAVSAAEVARRADVHVTSFHTPKQRKFGAEVKLWVEGLKSRTPVGRVTVRKELATRVADWKRLYDGLAQSHRDTELELQQCQAELSLAQTEIETLHAENERLRKSIGSASGKKVVPLQPK